MQSVRVLASVLVAVAAASTGGCGGNPGGGTAATDTVGAAPSGSAAGGGAATDRDTAVDSVTVDWSRADTVDVRLTEYRLQMPRALPPGPTIFRVTNAGATEHNFAVEGPGVDESFGLNLPPARTRGLQVMLRPGTYKVYCPVEDHVFEGMLLALEVSADASPDTVDDDGGDRAPDAPAPDVPDDGAVRDAAP